VIVEFKADVDINQAMEDAQRKINGIAADLPEDAKDPLYQSSLLMKHRS
jgi:HAE1 family hydrophobic/amphiphilic exporter-1